MSADIMLGDAVAALVAEKRAVGYKYVGEEKVLDRFAAFCRVEFPGLAAPSKAAVEAWIAAAQGRGVKPATLQHLVTPVRELARWLGRRGVPAYVLPQGVLPRSTRYVPHIYTDRELAALFAQTDRCRYCSLVPFRHLVMPVLFRTIYACGPLKPACCGSTMSTSTPACCRSVARRAARTGRCPSPRRCAAGSPPITSRFWGARVTGSSPARLGSQ